MSIILNYLPILKQEVHNLHVRIADIVCCCCFIVFFQFVPHEGTVKLKTIRRYESLVVAITFL